MNCVGTTTPRRRRAPTRERQLTACARRHPPARAACPANLRTCPEVPVAPRAARFRPSRNEPSVNPKGYHSEVDGTSARIGFRRPGGVHGRCASHRRDDAKRFHAILCRHADIVPDLPTAPVCRPSRKHHSFRNCRDCCNRQTRLAGSNRCATAGPTDLSLTPTRLARARRRPSRNDAPRPSPATFPDPQARPCSSHRPASPPSR